MKKIIFFITICIASFLSCPEAQAQDDGGDAKQPKVKVKKSKKSKGMGTQEDLDQDVQNAKERGMTKQDKKNLNAKKKEVAAKRKKDEITRKNADKIASKRYNDSRKKTSQKKKRWVKSHN